MAFVCVGCKKRFSEKKRLFENTDWCERCCNKDAKSRAAGEVGMFTSLPGYVTRPKGP